MTGSLIEACQWLGSASGCGSCRTDRPRAGGAFATPAMAYHVVCLLVSMVAFRFLRNLITRDRSWTHEPV